MIIQAFPSGPFLTNAYVVVCPQTNLAAVIDPAPGSFEPIQSYLTEHQYVPEKILLTHSHWDHIADVAPLKECYQIPVYVHPADAQNLISPGSDLLPCWIEIKGVPPDGWLAEEHPVTIGNLNFVVLHTPGHTPGGVCLYSKEQEVLFTGDTLFRGSIGNLSFPTSCPDLMWESLDKLSKLPPSTKAYPGHGPSTTLGKETWLPNAKKMFGD
jgi:hydroxyacylglutathione hydrolase